MSQIILGHVMSPLRNTHGKIDLFEAAQGGVAIDVDGVIEEVGEAKDLKEKYRSYEVTDYSDQFILPGFVDLHTHPPQLDIIGSFGSQLLEWLKKYTFPAELEFALIAVARERTNRYIDAQLRCGVTTGVWFGTTSLPAVQEMFAVAEQRGVRAVIGKVSMDQGAPQGLLQPVKQDIEDIDRLREDWHGKDGRLFVAITPRFAPSCSAEMLKGLGDYYQSHPELYVQTHVSESLAEVDLAMETHPGHKHYTGIYQDHGLLGSNTILAHCIHLTDDEIKVINDTQSIVAHCPTSNKFLGSGLCAMHEFGKKGLATDIGAGTALCIWETMRAAYGVAQLLGRAIKPVEMLANATIVAAETLEFPKKIGALAKGFDADLQVLEWQAVPLLSHRIGKAGSAEERLQALIAFGREGLNSAVYCSGRKIY